VSGRGGDLISVIGSGELFENNTILGLFIRANIVMKLGIIFDIMKPEQQLINSAKMAFLASQMRISIYVSH